MNVLLSDAHGNPILEFDGSPPAVGEVVLCRMPRKFRQDFGEVRRFKVTEREWRLGLSHGGADEVHVRLEEHE